MRKDRRSYTQVQVRHTWTGVVPLLLCFIPGQAGTGKLDKFFGGP